MVQRLVAVFLIVIGGAGRAQAQDAARSFSQLGAIARYGDRVRVLDVEGHEVRGLFYKVSPWDIEVSITRQGPTRWNESEIRRIQRRVNDPLRNGVRNGLIVGAGLGLIQGLYLRKTHIRGIVPLTMAVHSALCMPFGAGIDALISRQEVIFERPGEPVTATTAPAKSTGITVVKF